MDASEKWLRRTKTAVVVLALITFVVVAIYQFYDSGKGKNGDERLVLGLDNDLGEFSGAGLAGSPAPMKDMIALVSGGSFMVVTKNAENLADDNFMLSDPVIRASGSYCIAGDYGGKKVKLYEKGKAVTEIDTDGELISAVTNSSGSFAVATGQVGYDAVVTVYKKDGTPIYRYNIRDKSFIDMDISPNNRLLLIAEANLKDGDTGTTVTVAEFNREDAKTVFDVKSNMYLSVHFNKSSSFVCFGSTGTDVYRVDGTKIGSISYDGRVPAAADISEDDMICLGFNTDAGSIVYIYNKQCKLRGEAEFSSSVTYICANGAHAAVSYGNNVDIITPKGNVKAALQSSSPVKYAAPFGNGRSAVVFAGGNTEILKG